MKKLMFFILALFFMNSNINAQAESYTDFEWDILRLGYAVPSGLDNLSSGVALGTEARYNLKDEISIGLRWEIAVYGSSDVAGSSVEIGAAGSIALMGDYYFNTESSKRPFAGLGIGTFSGGSVSTSTTTVDAGNSIGIIPRVGYEFGHLRIAAEYNLAFSDNVASYIGIHLAATLFGGYDG